jgi:8-oxo-dGTP pyrophosphatase MutT (NUDIX family)
LYYKTGTSGPWGGPADLSPNDRLLRLRRRAAGQQPRPCRQRGRSQRRRRHPADPARGQRQLALPGGAIDLGESVAQAAREALEATGIECEVTGIVGIYSDPKHVILYTSNGEARQEFSIVLTARPISGQPTPGRESSDVRWVPEAELPSYTMDRSMRIRINDFLSRSDAAVIT